MDLAPCVDRLHAQKLALSALDYSPGPLSSIVDCFFRPAFLKFCISPSKADLSEDGGGLVPFSILEDTGATGGGGGGGGGEGTEDVRGLN